MKISKTHQEFSERLNQPDALTNPEKYLGPNYQDVLNFWIYIDTLSKKEIKKIENRYWYLNDNVQLSVSIAAHKAADEVVGCGFRDAAFYAAYDATGRGVFGDATCELIGLQKLEEQRKPLLSYSFCLGEEIVNFSASGGILSIINEIRDNYNLNRSEIIRRAVSLFFIAKREQQKGNRLAVIDSDGNVISDIHSF